LIKSITFLKTGVIGLGVALSSPFAAQAQDLHIDHILWATPDIAAEAKSLETRSGIQPVYGGAHPGRGTANYLISLGAETYLEIIGPNPDTPNEHEPRTDMMRNMTASAVYTFAVSTSNLDAFASAADELGLGTIGPTPGARDVPSGETLRWQTLFVSGHDFGDAIPFAIDWGDSTHPATTSPMGAEFISMTINHPRASDLQVIYEKLGVPVRVAQADTAEFIVRIGTPNGDLELRGVIAE
jgi:hypothetical protein